MRRALRAAGLLAPGLLVLAALARPARAESPWEAEVRTAVREQETVLAEARRNHTTGSVVSRYQSRLDRQPTALAHYLVGRAQFHHGDHASAERSLRRVLEIEPRFWFARLGLAMIAFGRDDLAGARSQVDAALRDAPDDADLLKMRVQVLAQSKEWDAALAALGRLIEKEPGDLLLRKRRIEILLEKKDWTTALAELQTLESRAPDDPVLRWNTALVLVRLKRLEEAARRLETLARTQPAHVQTWALLQDIYAQRLDERLRRGETQGAGFEADRANLIRALERMAPLLGDATSRKRIEVAIEELRKDPVAVRAPAPAAVEESAEQEWIRVVDQCLDETNVERRRKGLRAFYGLLQGEGAHPGAAIPVPTAFFTRIHESIEPDPTCRAWLMRILGSAGAHAHPFLAMYAAFALYDPETEVRRTAAEALASIRTPAGVVYLRAFVGLVPTGPEASESDVAEFNAARIGLATLTGHEDVPGARDAWLTGEDAAAAAKHWAEFFRTPEGAALLVEGIRDLATIGEMFPQRHLVALVDEPVFDVAKAAYVGLLERSKGPPHGATETPLERQFWPKFPRLAVEDITPDSVQRARDVVRAWWEEWLRARETAAKAVGSPDAPAPSK